MVMRRFSGSRSASLSSFVGRERELEEVSDALRKCRLLSLTGAGGVGKSRLALTAAMADRGEYADGVHVVELASLADPRLVPKAVAIALDIQEQPNRPLHVTLAEALAERSLLLVLDNCEHLVDGCAQLADDLLRVCPGVRLLTTSRQRLRIAGETVWRGLPTPSVEAILQSDAGRLFVVRVRAVQAGFEVTPSNATTIAEICVRLDGIPWPSSLPPRWSQHLGWSRSRRD